MIESISNNVKLLVGIIREHVWDDKMTKVFFRIIQNSKKKFVTYVFAHHLWLI